MLLALSKESAWATVLHPSSSRKHSPSSVHPGNSPRASSSASPLSCVLPLSGCSLLHCHTTFPLLYSTASLNWSWYAAEIRSLSRTLISTECQNHCEINALCSWTANKRWGGADRRKNIVWLWCVKSEFPCCCFDFWWKNYNNECLSKKKIAFFIHEELKGSYELVYACPCVPDRIGIWKCWFLRREENRSTRRKITRSKGENQQQTQPTYGVKAGTWTRATLVGGECSHHCATLAPLSKL